MKDSLFQYWDRLPRRDKLICFAAACVLLLYITYTFTIKNSMRDALGKRAHLVRLNAEYASLQSNRQRQEGLKGGLASLQLELKAKMAEERLLAESVQSRRPVESLLHELRQTAGQMPLQLVAMDIKTGMVSQSSQFINRSPLVTVEGISQNASQSERVGYTVSKIVLSYRSNYADAIDYFEKVMDLPYAISVNSVEMERSNAREVAGDDPKRHIGGNLSYGEMPLNTKLGIEIFYR